MGAFIRRLTGFFLVVTILPVSAFAAVLNLAVTGSGSIRGPEIHCRDLCSEEIETGTVITLRADPNRGWVFAGWSGDVSGGGDSIDVAMDGDRTVFALFTEEVEEYTITAHAGFGGAISPSGNVQVPGGDSRTFSIVPDGGYQIEDVSVDGSSIGAAASYTFTDVSADHSIRATFTPETTVYVISASAGSGGTISPSGSVTVLQGENRRFAVTPGTGYHIADVRIDGSSVGAVSSYTFTGVSSDHSIHATFEVTAADTYAITATAGTGGGIVPSGRVTVTKGDTQSFSITPDSGFEIGDVLVDGASVGKPAQYSFRNVQADHTIQATFQSVSGPYTLNVAVSEGGSVSTDPLGRTFAPGTTVRLTAVASTGYAFDSWSGDLTGRSNPAEVVMDSNKTVNAAFLLDQDVDGESDTEEWGPDGTNAEYDGNGDGIPDCRQANVVSLHTYDGRQYLTMEGPEGSTFTGTAVGSLPEGAPGGYSYPYGLITFRITGIQPGSAVQVRIFLKAGNTITTYYKYNAGEAKWERFDYDDKSRTGVQIDNSIITMSFVDGGRGDQDGTADGVITDPGTLAVRHSSESWYQKCFISTAGSPSNGNPAWTALLLLAVFALSWKRSMRG